MGSLWAAVSSGHHLMFQHGGLWGLQGNLFLLWSCCSQSYFSYIFPHSSLSSHAMPFLEPFCSGKPSLADGLICVLSWVRWKEQLGPPWTSLVSPPYQSLCKRKTTKYLKPLFRLPASWFRWILFLIFIDWCTLKWHLMPAAV